METIEIVTIILAAAAGLAIGFLAGYSYRGHHRRGIGRH
jgi:hypothetical protein